MKLWRIRVFQGLSRLSPPFFDFLDGRENRVFMGRLHAGFSGNLWLFLFSGSLFRPKFHSFSTYHHVCIHLMWNWRLHKAGFERMRRLKRRINAPSGTTLLHRLRILIKNVSTGLTGLSWKFDAYSQFISRNSTALQWSDDVFRPNIETGKFQQLDRLWLGPQFTRYCRSSPATTLLESLMQIYMLYKGLHKAEQANRTFDNIATPHLTNGGWFQHFQKGTVMGL